MLHKNIVIFQYLYGHNSIYYVSLFYTLTFLCIFFNHGGYIMENDDYVTVESTNGLFVKSQDKMYTDYLPDVIISSIPIELQELYYSADGKGRRTAYGYHHTETLDFTNPKFPAPLKSKLHKHNYFELMLVASGKLNMQIESKLCEVNSLDVCILNCNTRHAEQFIPDGCVYYIVLSPEYLKEWPKENGMNLRHFMLFKDFFMKDISDTMHQNKDYIMARNVNLEVFSQLDDIIKNIRREFEEKHPGFQLVVRGLLFRFFSILSNPKFYKTEYIDLGADNGFALAYSAKRLLDKYKHKITVREISEQLNYSEEHVNRIFKKHYGQTIPEYNRLVCLRQAAYLLSNTHCHVHTICKQLGFRNRTHFYLLFKNKYGCTPTEYRKKDR